MELSCTAVVLAAMVGRSPDTAHEAAAVVVTLLIPQNLDMQEGCTWRIVVETALLLS